MYYLGSDSRNSKCTYLKFVLKFTKVKVKNFEEAKKFKKEKFQNKL